MSSSSFTTNQPIKTPCFLARNPLKSTSYMTIFTSKTSLKNTESPLPLPLCQTTMSSSTLCQGLQSCLEPKSLDPHDQIQNLSPQKPPQKNEPEPSFWSSITAQNSGKDAYDHLSSLTLSSRSLEMCTESLGSETGSSIGESIDDFYKPLVPEGFQSQPWRLRESQKKVFRAGSFPPPLTSISGTDGVQVSSHREDGRLVLRAVSVSSCSCFFRTERSNGRLRLSLYKSLDSKELDEVQDDDKEDVEVNGNYGEEDEDEEEDLGVANGENENEHVGFDDFPRLRTRCKEGGGNRNKGISNWEPFWVAIS